MKDFLRILLIHLCSLIGMVCSPLYKFNQRSKLVKELLYGQLIKFSFNKPRPSVLLAVRPINIIRGEKITLGNKVLIGQHSILSVWSANGEIVLSDNVVIGTSAHITAINKIEIGKGTLLGKHVTITDHSHGYVNYEESNVLPIKRDLHSKGPVVIGENIWIGDKVTVLPNVTIGSYSIIGANSVVTKSIPPYSVACGNPARIVKSLVDNDLD